MNKLCLVGFFVLLTAVSAVAQDEGDVVVKSRFEKSNGIYFAFGPSFTLGKNLGDYSNGFNFELGYLKRTNKLISLGPNFTYLFFNYDADKTYPYYYDEELDNALELAFEGGNVQIMSLGLNVKLNFIPVSDHSVFSLYGIVNPFVCLATKTETTGEVIVYEDSNLDGTYKEFVGSIPVDGELGDGFDTQNNVSGGVHAGFGMEFLPARTVSFFLQATFNYTLPINYISTEEWTKDDQTYYVDVNDNIYYDVNQSLYEEDFPLVKKGFSALSVKVGLKFNF